MFLNRFFEPYRKSIEIAYHDWFQTNFNSDPLKRDLYLTFVCIFLVYWIVGFIYLFIDLIALKWSFLYRFKIQPKNLGQSFELKRFIRLLFIANINIIVCFFIAIFINYIPLLHVAQSDHIPTFCRFIYEFIVSIFIVEAGFYYVHRTLHHPYFYKNIHKVHHDWQAPISLSFFDVHPLENILVNALPILAGPWLLCSHPLFTWFWILFALIVGMSNHSGWYYIVNILGPPLFHDYHHNLFIGNYGLIGLFDRLHGTDKFFRHSNYYQNFRIILGFAPISIEDRNKKIG